MVKALMSRFLSRNSKNTLIYLCSSIFGAAIGFIMLRKFTFYLGAEDIGIFGYVTAVNTFLIPFFTLNLESFYIKEVYDTSITPERKKVLLGTIFIFTLVWTLIMTAVFTLGGSVVFHLLHIKVPFFPFMFYTLLSNLFLGTTVIAMIQYRILSKPWMYFLINALQSSAVIFIGYWMVAGLRMGILGRIDGVLWGNILVGLFCMLLMRKHLKWAVDRELLRKAIKFCLPLVPYTLANLLFDLLDRFFLERYFDKLSYTGIYNMGAQYSLIISMLSLAFYRAYEAEIFRLSAIDDHKGINKSMIMLNNVMFGLALPLVLCSGPLINYLTHGKFPGSALIACLLIVAFFFRSAYIMLNTILTAQGKTKEIFWFSLAGLAFVIAASMFIVPLYDNVGTAIIKIVLYVLMFLCSFLIIRKAAGYNKYIVHTLLTGSILLLLSLSLRYFSFV